MARSAVDRRDNGRYRARYLGPDNRWRSKTFDRKVDAERWLRSSLGNVDRGDWIDPAMARVRLGQVADRWLVAIANLKPKTRTNYESLLRVHVLPAFGEWELRRIDRLAIREWLARLQANDLSTSRVRQARQVLVSILELAVEAGHVSANAGRGLKVAGGQRQEMLHLDAHQVAVLSDAVDQIQPGSGTLVLVLAYCGLRWGEAVALRRGRCDLLHSRLQIRESMAEVSGELHFGPTKTHQDRTILLPPFLRDRLSEHMAAHVDRTTAALVFTSPNGQPLRNSNWRNRVWRPACEESGMPEGLRPHDLRHTAASLLVSAGANVKAVQRHLGHATATQTLDRYTHLFTEDLEAVAERLEEVWRSQIASSARPGPGLKVSTLKP